MFGWRRPHCPCGGRIRKVEFYLDPYNRWDHYYCCNTCGTHGATVDAVKVAAPLPLPLAGEEHTQQRSAG
jgi:hypothetical protein